MIRIMAILISVLFLSGFGWFTSVDCEDVADSIIYNEGVSHLNDKEKKIRRKVYEWYKPRHKHQRPLVVAVCENGIKYYGWLD